MILTDREIQLAIQEEQLFITPKPKPEAYSATTVDLTLDRPIKIWRTGAANSLAGVETPEKVICPAAPGYSFDEVVKEHTDPRTMGPKGFVLVSGGFILAWTKESVKLPPASRFAGRVEGKSSLARLGIGVHVTAPIIHPGFKGQIQLEMFNHGPLRVRLLPKMKVCQLVFELTLGAPAKGYKGMFSGQTAK